MVGADGGFDECGERRGIEKKEQPPRPVGGGAFACGSHFQTCTNLGASLTVTRTVERRRTRQARQGNFFRTHDRNQELFGKWGLGDANVGKWGFGDANVGKWGFGDANVGKWGFGARTWGSGASARKLPGKWGLGARTSGEVGRRRVNFQGSGGGASRPESEEFSHPLSKSRLGSGGSAEMGSGGRARKKFQVGPVPG